MIQITFIAEDTTLVAIWNDKDRWSVLAKDTFSGHERMALWDYQQLGAVLYLMAGTGEEERTDKELTAVMYSIAEPLFKDWPRELRPIP